MTHPKWLQPLPVATRRLEIELSRVRAGYTVQEKYKFQAF